MRGRRRSHSLSTDNLDANVVPPTALESFNISRSCATPGTLLIHEPSEDSMSPDPVAHGEYVPLTAAKREAAWRTLYLAQILWTIVLPRSGCRWVNRFPCDSKYDDSGGNGGASRYIRALQYTRMIILGSEVHSSMKPNEDALTDSSSLAQLLCDAWSGAVKQWPSVSSPAVTRYPNNASFEVDSTAAMLLNLAEAFFPLVPLVCKSLAFLADLNVQSVDPRNELGGSDALVAAIQVDSQRCVSWILNNRRKWCKPGAYENIFLAACSSGNWDVCRSMWKIVHSQAKLGLGQKSILHAIANGHVSLAENLSKLFHTAISPEPLMLQLSCSGGHAETAQWLCRQFEFRRPGQRNCIAAKSMQACCAHGHLALAQWLVKEFNLTREDITGSVLDSSMAWACRYGHIQVCHWLSKEFKISLSDIVDASAIEACCEGGHIGVLDWMHSEFDLSSIPDSTKVDALLMCCTKGNLSVAKWLHSHFAARSFNPPEQYMKESCKAGHLEITKWLLAVFPVSINVAKKCIKLACKGRHVKLAQYLYQQFNFLDPMKTFNICCVQLGDVEFAQWIMETNPVEFEDSTQAEKLFSDCCSKGHLPLVKWLWATIFQDLADFSAEVKELSAKLVPQICSSSYLLPTAAWLCTEFNIVSTPAIEAAFLDACSKYNFITAWWLYVTFQFPQSSPTFREALEKTYPGSRMNLFLKQLAGI
ncbi:hypothetical protein Pelo_8049 [Pelomyxa schiedti]|nr:hypothetical protein Pelo_8049 [Pelomyxa schiedti]